MNRKSLFFVSMFILAALLLAACAPTEVVKTVEVEVTRVVTEEVIVEVEVTPVPEEGETEPAAPAGDVEIVTLAALAEAIRAGEVDVGEEFGTALGQRFHNIHAQTVGMACNQCHVDEADAPDEVAPAPVGAPGVVDRRVCAGCHLNGPATLLFEPKE
jgi:hypothetical protein